MKGGSFLIIGSLILAIFSVQAATIAAEGEVPTVIINELAWAGSSSSSQDEWIELKNTTDTDIDLTRWQITKDTSGDNNNETLTIEILENPEDSQANIMAAGGYFLISNNNQDHDFGDGKFSVLNIEPDYIDSSITLSNTKLLVKLYDGQWDDGREPIDIAGDGGSPFFGSNSAKTSMERNGEYGLGDLSENWHEATEAINLDEGVFDQATPQAPNSSPSLPTPTVKSVSPNTAEIGATLEIEEITGEYFVIEGTTQIQINKDGNIISATDVHVASSTVIDSAQLDLATAVPGDWDLIVINPDGQATILPSAIQLTEPEEEIVYSNNIIISELYPRPDTSSNDEFIELHNRGDNSVNLKGWKLDDQYPGGSAEYTINHDLIIEAGDYISLTKLETHISLNDTGDYARLIQPDGSVLNEAPNYGSARKGYSYSLMNETWQWSLRVTKNQANVLEMPLDDEEAESVLPEDIEISLDFDDVESDSVLLTWSINLSDTITTVTAYQSEQEETLGQFISSVPTNNQELVVDNLAAHTTYFFTIASNWQGQMIKSNQIEITTSPEIINNPGISGQIKITEILPNPPLGKDEFIELHNPTEEPVNIAGWQLVDASSRSYTINSLDLPPISLSILQVGSVIIQPRQYILLEQNITGIHLNNSGGEELYLLDTDDNTIDSVSYSSSAKRGYVYALAPNGQWFWSEETTPGEANDISFAGMTEDSSEYLTSSGPETKLVGAGLISLMLSGIIWLWMKKYGEAHNH